MIRPCIMKCGVRFKTSEDLKMPPKNLSLGRRGGQCDLTHVPPCTVLQVRGAAEHWYAMGKYEYKPTRNAKALLFESKNKSRNKNYTKYQIKVQKNGKIVLRSRNKNINRNKKQKKWSQLIKGKHRPEDRLTFKARQFSQGS